MTDPKPPPSDGPRISADLVQCALQDRVLGLGQQAMEPLWRALLLTSGRASARLGEESIALRAPSLTWFPWRPGQTLTVHAGAVGYQIAVNDEALIGAIGNNPEAVDLRYLVERRIVAGIVDDEEIVTDAGNAFDLIVRELNRRRSGSLTMVQAQLRAVLVMLWRLSGAEGVALQAQGEPSRILQRFRQLVELHFRDRWPVVAYAEAIGISTDRLHDICRRKLGKTPSRLVQERVVHEARQRLERSALTVEQVANSLGFRDVGHFSRFFKARAGLPPAAYRRQAILPHREGAGQIGQTYADWP